MVPAFGMVILPQNLSTINGQVPGWSCILSVGTLQRLEYEHSEHNHPSGVTITSAGLRECTRTVPFLSRLPIFSVDWDAVCRRPVRGLLTSLHRHERQADPEPPCDPQTSECFFCFT